MKAFTIYRLGKIKNKWITDALSEIISTFILALFVYASGAQSVLSKGEASSVVGRALAASCGLSMAVYCGFNASGACVNPCIALMFCLTGKLQWKRWPLYVVCELIGAFIAACLTYGVYYELIDQFESGARTVYGDTATSHIFTSFPLENISKKTAFFEVAVGCGLLTSLTCMLIDPNNANPAPGLIPVALTIMLFPILLSFSSQAGAPVNLTIDFSGRFLAYLVYGPEVYTRANYWFWVPPVACFTGTLVSVFWYQFMVGNHLPRNKETEPEVENSQHPEVMFNSKSVSTLNTSIATLSEKL